MILIATPITEDLKPMLEAAAYGVPGILMFSPQFPKRAAYPSILYRMAAAVKADCDHYEQKNESQCYFYEHIFPFAITPCSRAR